MTQKQIFWGFMIGVFGFLLLKASKELHPTPVHQTPMLWPTLYRVDFTSMQGFNSQALIASTWPKQAVLDTFKEHFAACSCLVICDTILTATISEDTTSWYIQYK